MFFLRIWKYFFSCASTLQMLALFLKPIFWRNACFWLINFGWTNCRENEPLKFFYGNFWKTEKLKSWWKPIVKNGSCLLYHSYIFSSCTFQRTINNFDTSIIIYLTQKVDLIDIIISWKCIFLESSVRYLSKEMKHISRYLKGEKHVKNSHFYCLRALTHYSFLLN